MPEEVSLGGGAFASPAEGNAASAMGNSVVNSRLSVDLKMLQGLNDELNKLNENTKKIKTNFKGLIADTKELTKELNKAATAMGKVSGKSGSSYMDTGKGMPPAADLQAMRDMQLDTMERIMAMLGGGGAARGGGLPGGGIGGGKILGGLQAFAGNPYVQMAGQAVQAAGQTIDNRVDRNRSYALPADKLSVQLQQQYGMSQMDVMTQLRGPLRQYRLGAGGINELLSMQSRTGLSAQQQAGSVESMRTLMGYGYSAGDVTNYIESMAQADTVNRMFMMTGTSIYGIGGTQKSAQQVNQELIQRLGLNNRELIQAGRQSGSVIRQRLQMAGLDEGAQDMLLQYAEANVGFRERGGQGFYDPSKKADRARMGIEGNYATQAEETERVKVDREEQMYKRQADNYAQMEKNLQNVNKLLKEFEDRLSGLVGAKTNMRTGGFLRTAGAVLGGVAGFALGGPAGIMPGVTAGGMVGGFFGDPTDGSSASPGRIAAEKPTKKIANESMLAKLKPVLREPLARIMSDRPGITIGQGYRSAEEQKTMFLQRYVRTDKKTNTYYDGSYWEKKPGVPMAAPPGLSYHEIGLAADLRFATDADAQWFKLNASKYGLDEFSRYGEPWHVQSKAYPTSRKQYEESGASYGTENSPGLKYINGTIGVTRETGPGGQSGSGMDQAAVTAQQLLLSESMAIFANKQAGKVNLSPNQQRLLLSDETKQDVHSRSRSGVKVNGVPKAPQDIPSGFYWRTTPSYGGWGYYVPKNFTDADLEALHKQEQPSWNVGPITNSHGTFYGGFSMNDYNWLRAKAGLSGNLAGKPKGLHGKLYDTSNWEEHANDTVERQKLAAEYLLDELSAHNGWEPIVRGTVDWPGVGKLPSVSIPNAGTTTMGDPIDTGYTPNRTSTSTPAKSSTANVMTTNNNYSINPTINITSSGSTSIDASRIAKEVARLVEKEVRMTAVRSS